MIGITCSIIVVLITTYVQFKYEQKKSLNSMLTNIQHFYFQYLLVVMSLDPEEHVPDKLWEHYYDSLLEDIKNIMRGLNEIEWFSKKKEKTTTELYKGFINLWITMNKALDIERECSVKEIVADPALKDIKVNAMLLAVDNSRVGEEIEKNYNEAEAYLEELREKGHWNK